MAISTPELISQIDSMTVLELNTLVKALEEHYGVSAAAAAVPMAGAGGEGRSPGWRVDPGRHELHVGTSSAAIARVVAVDVTA